MNIIFTVHTYWPNKDGVQYVTQYLAEGLAKKGHYITVFVSVKNKEDIGEEVYNGVRIIRVYLYARYSVFVKGKNKFVKRFLFEASKADAIINCCTQSPINNCILPLLKKISCKKILYLHGIHGFKYNRGEFRNIKYLMWHFVMNQRWRCFYTYHRNDFRRYDLIIDIHESSEAFSLFDKKHIFVKRRIIHNAVESFNESFDNDLCVEKNKYFLCVANYVEQKNQMMLLEVFKRIKNNYNYKLVMIGRSSDYSKRLKDYVLSNNLSNKVIVLEDVDRQMTKSYIKNCYCAVLSSQREIFPIFLCEALMCGHPFISTSVGCISEIPGGFTVNSIGSFVEKVKYAILHCDEMEKLGESGKQFALRNFAQEEKIDELNNALKSLF